MARLLTNRIFLLLAVSGVTSPTTDRSSIADDVPQAPPAQYSLAEVLAGLKQAHSRIDSILIAYRMDAKPEQRQPRGAFLHRTLALKSPGYALHENAHGQAEFDAKDDPMRIRCVMSLDEYFVTRVNNATYRHGDLDLNEPLIGTFSNELALWAFGIWPLENRPAPKLYGEIAYAIPDYVAEIGEKELRPFQEQVNNAWCHVIDRPGIDTLWLDGARNWAMVRRQIAVRGTSNPFRRYTGKNFREVLPGIWLPASVDELRWTGGDAPTRWTMIIEDYRINQLPDSFFQYEPPPGAVEFDSDGMWVQIDDDLSEHFANVLRISAKLIDQRRPELKSVWLIPAAVVLLAIWFSLERYAGRVRRASMRRHGRPRECNLNEV